MSRKKITRGVKKETQEEQDILKLYIDGQLEFRKALVNAATAISVQSETSRSVVDRLKDLIDKIDNFEEKLDTLEKKASTFEDSLVALQGSASKTIEALKDSAEKSIEETKNKAVKEISKKKMTVVIMFFFLALASVLGAYSLAGSKIKTEVSTSGVSIEAKTK
jgi:hypothetical protein